MSWNDDHYLKDEDGNFESEKEFGIAIEKGDVEKLSNSDCYWDRETGEEYWPDGTRK